MSTFKLFKEYHDKKSRMVGFPGYTPLGQKVLVKDIDERKKKRNEYAKKYYAEHREHMCELSRQSYNRRRGKKQVDTVVEVDKSKDYLEEIIDKISGGLVTQNKELIEENRKLKERVNVIENAWMEHKKAFSKFERLWNKSYNDLDQLIKDK